MNIASRFSLLLFLVFFSAGITSAQSFESIFAARMAIYANHGLVYNSEKEAYLFNNKIVGFFMDYQGFGITILNRAGEIHIKVNRDDAGKIIDIVELSQEEYAQLLEDMDAMHIALSKQMAEMQEHLSQLRNNLAELESHLNQNRDFLRLVPPPAPPVHLWF
jgi:hypothetical protein